MLFIKFAAVRKRSLRVDISHFLRLYHWWFVILGRIVDVWWRPVCANKTKIGLLQTVVALLRMPHTHLVVILDALVFVRIRLGSRSSILIWYSGSASWTLVGPEMRYARLRTIHYARISILIINQAGSIHIKVIEALNTAPTSNFIKVDVSIATCGQILLQWSQFKILFERVIDVHRAFPCITSNHLFDRFLRP